MSLWAVSARFGYRKLAEYGRNFLKQRFSKHELFSRLFLCNGWSFGRGSGRKWKVLAFIYVFWQFFQIRLPEVGRIWPKFLKTAGFFLKISLYGLEPLNWGSLRLRYRLKWKMVDTSAPTTSAPTTSAPTTSAPTTLAPFLEKILLPLVKTLWPLMKRHIGSSQMTIRPLVKDASAPSNLAYKTAYTIRKNKGFKISTQFVSVHEYIIIIYIHFHSIYLNAVWRLYMKNNQSIRIIYFGWVYVLVYHNKVFSF